MDFKRTARSFTSSMNVIFSSIYSCLICASLLVPCVRSHGRHNNEQFEQWKQQYGRRYHTSDIEQQRQHNFNANAALVAQHNSQSTTTYKLQLNHFSDQSIGELRTLNGNRHMHDRNHHWHAGSDDGENTQAQTTTQTPPPASSTGIPQSVDWRNSGAVTPVTSQGSCGCCWAVSAAEAIEGQVAIKRQKLVQLSKQFLIDCDTSDLGCNGGWVMNAFNYAAQSGLPSEADYPYTGQKGPSCRSSVPLSVAANPGSTPGKYLPQNEDEIASAVATIGPISVSINADDHGFYFYSSGVYLNPACDNKPGDVNHAVLIVGYDNTASNGGPYWIVKNSWGTQYGENGYIRMAKGVNQCGIANWAMYPTFIS